MNTDQDNWRTLVFVTEVESRICTVAWKTLTGTFSDWIQVAGGLAHPGSPVTVISRAKGKIDVFVVGSDLRVYTIIYDVLDNSVEWQPIGDLQVPSGLRVTPVLHPKDEVDILVTDFGGKILYCFVTVYQTVRVLGMGTLDAPC